MKTSILAFLLLTVGTGLFLGVIADEETVEAADETETVVEESTETFESTPTHPLTDLPPSHEDVETTVLFAEHPDRAMPSGEKVEMLMGFHNGGEGDLNITGIMGSLNSPLDFRVYIQNFSMKMLSQNIGANEDASFDYVFTPDANLQPRDFAVAVTVFYEGAGEKYSTTFFNDSVYIIEPSSYVDVETIFAYVFVLAIVGLLIGLVVRGLQSAGIVKKSMKMPRKVETSSSRGGEAENEWLKGTFAVGGPSAKKPTKKAKKKN